MKSVSDDLRRMERELAERAVALAEELLAVTLAGEPFISGAEAARRVDARANAANTMSLDYAAYGLELVPPPIYGIRSVPAGKGPLIEGKVKEVVPT